MRRLSLALLVVALASVGCSQEGKARPPGEVGMTAGLKFEPAEITIDAGDTVTWVNDSTDVHTVTALEDGIPEGADYFATGGFDSERAAREELGEGLMSEGDEFEVTFEEPGTYRYVCLPHESQGMLGSVVVR